MIDALSRAARTSASMVARRRAGTLAITHTHKRAGAKRTAVSMAALAAMLNFIPDRGSPSRPFLQFGGCDGSRHGCLKQSATM